MEKMRLRRLRERGIREMDDYLDSLKSDNPSDFPQEVLTDPSFSDSVSDVEIEPRQFQNKYEVASCKLSHFY